MKAIVLGCNGYLGSHICKTLKDKNIFVTGIDLAENPKEEFCDEYFSLDITKSDALSKIDFKADYLFQFIGATGSFDSILNYTKYIQINEIGLLNVLSAIKSLDPKERPLVVFPSSRLVYQGQKNKSLTENEVLFAKTIYAQNKISCESYMNIFKNVFDIDYVIFRIGVPYGNSLSNDYSYGTIGMLLSQCKKNRKISLFGDGNLMRTFTYVQDICEMMWSTIKNDSSFNKTYNIHGENLKLKTIASKIADKFEVPIEYVPWPEKALKIESGDTIFNSESILASMEGSLNYTKFDDWISKLIVTDDK